MKKILAVLVLVLSTTVFAKTVDIDATGLSEAQVAELKAVAAKAVADASKAGTPTLLNMSAWGQQAASAAEGIAKAIGIAAKELNVSVNDFLHTDAGKLATAVILWKVLGSTITGLMGAIIAIVLWIVIFRIFYIRLFTKGYEKVEYSRFGGLFKGTRMVRVYKSFQDLSEDGEWLVLWIMILYTVITMLIVLL